MWEKEFLLFYMYQLWALHVVIKRVLKRLIAIKLVQHVHHTLHMLLHYLGEIRSPNLVKIAPSS